MKDHDRVPLICDSPPQRKVVLIVSHLLTAEQAARIREAWRRAIDAPGTGPIVLEAGWEVREIGGGADGWPDAEFCAA